MTKSGRGERRRRGGEHTERISICVVCLDVTVQLKPPYAGKTKPVTSEISLITHPPPPFERGNFSGRCIRRRGNLAGRGPAPFPVQSWFCCELPPATQHRTSTKRDDSKVDLRGGRHKSRAGGGGTHDGLRARSTECHVSVSGFVFFHNRKKKYSRAFDFFFFHDHYYPI